MLYENAENNPMTMSSLNDIITSNKMEWNNSIILLSFVVNFININVVNKNAIEFKNGTCKKDIKNEIPNRAINKK